MPAPHKLKRLVGPDATVAKPAEQTNPIIRRRIIKKTRRGGWIA